MVGFKTGRVRYDIHPNRTVGRKKKSATAVRDLYGFERFIAPDQQQPGSLDVVHARFGSLSEITPGVTKRNNTVKSLLAEIKL